MADTSYHSAPKLGPTADEVPYSPISWLAVAAGLSALIFAVIFVLLAIFSFMKKQPMIMPPLLILPIVTLVLSFAAYCHINNSEGTRTGNLFGLNLIVFSGLIAVLGGAGYLAYLGAMEFAVRKDAENIFTAWIANLTDLSQDDMHDPSIAKAFHSTLEPSSQQRISATDVNSLRNAFTDQYAQFYQCDLLRICRRNPKQITIKPLGLVNWEREQQRIRCTLNANLLTPEGVHTISLEMLADIAPNGSRLWGLQNKPSYVTAQKLTPYGKAVEELEHSGLVTAQRFLDPINGQFLRSLPDPLDADAFRRKTYYDFIANPYPPAKDIPLFPKVFNLAIAGGLASVDPRTLGYEKKLFDTVFVPTLQTAGMSPDDRSKMEAEMRTKFAMMWNGNRIMRAGQMNRQTKDVFPILIMKEKSVRVMVPCEMMLPGSDAPANHTRARITVECTDEKVIGNLNKLRSESKPELATFAGHVQLPENVVPWKVTKIESDLRLAPQAHAQRMDMPAPSGH